MNGENTDDYNSDSGVSGNGSSSTSNCNSVDLLAIASAMHTVLRRRIVYEWLHWMASSTMCSFVCMRVPLESAAFNNTNHAQVAKEKKSESDFKPFAYTCAWEFIPLRFWRAIKLVATVHQRLSDHSQYFPSLYGQHNLRAKEFKYRFWASKIDIQWHR